jgi:hypothetical protein
LKILSCKYRNRRRRYSLRVNLLAAIYNYELGIGIATSKKLPNINQVKDNLFSIFIIEIVCAA